jgi:hypothetical protein
MTFVWPASWLAPPLQSAPSARRDVGILWGRQRQISAPDKDSVSGGGAASPGAAALSSNCNRSAGVRV